MTDDWKAADTADGWDGVVRELRRAPRVDAAAIDGVMAAVLASPVLVAPGAPVSPSAPARPGALAWLLRPRLVALTPMHAIAAALLLALALGAARRGRGIAPAAPTVAATTPAAGTPTAVPVTPVAEGTATGRRVVQFVFVSPEAREVAIVGDFNDWQAGATPLRRGPARGLWTVEVGLEPGRYTYAFVVDGTRWVPDEAAPRARDDEFGGEKSVIYVRTQS